MSSCTPENPFLQPSASPTPDDPQRGEIHVHHVNPFQYTPLPHQLPLVRSVILDTECTSKPPTPGISLTHSLLTGKPLPTVPVVHIHGRLADGQTLTTHLHNWFPYVLYPVDEMAVGKIRHQLRDGLVLQAIPQPQDTAPTTVVTPHRTPSVSLVPEMDVVLDRHSLAFWARYTALLIDHIIFLKLYLSAIDTGSSPAGQRTEKTSRGNSAAIRRSTTDSEMHDNDDDGAENEDSTAPRTGDERRPHNPTTKPSRLNHRYDGVRPYAALAQQQQELLSLAASVHHEGSPHVSTEQPVGIGAAYGGPQEGEHHHNRISDGNSIASFHPLSYVVYAGVCHAQHIYGYREHPSRFLVLGLCSHSALRAITSFLTPLHNAHFSPPLQFMTDFSLTYGTRLSIASPLWRLPLSQRFPPVQPPSSSLVHGYRQHVPSQHTLSANPQMRRNHTHNSEQSHINSATDPVRVGQGTPLRTLHNLLQHEEFTILHDSGTPLPASELHTMVSRGADVYALHEQFHQFLRSNHPSTASVPFPPTLYTSIRKQYPHMQLPFVPFYSTSDRRATSTINDDDEAVGHRYCDSNDHEDFSIDRARYRHPSSVLVHIFPLTWNNTADNAGHYGDTYDHGSHAASYHQGSPTLDFSMMIACNTPYLFLLSHVSTNHQQYIKAMADQYRYLSLLPLNSHHHGTGGDASMHAVHIGTSDRLSKKDQYNLASLAASLRTRISLLQDGIPPSMNAIVPLMIPPMDTGCHGISDLARYTSSAYECDIAVWQLENQLLLQLETYQQPFIQRIQELLPQRISPPAVSRSQSRQPTFHHIRPVLPSSLFSRADSHIRHPSTPLIGLGQPFYTLSMDSGSIFDNVDVFTLPIPYTPQLPRVTSSQLTGHHPSGQSRTSENKRKMPGADIVHSDSENNGAEPPPYVMCWCQLSSSVFMSLAMGCLCNCNATVSYDPVTNRFISLQIGEVLSNAHIPSQDDGVNGITRTYPLRVAMCECIPPLHSISPPCSRISSTEGSSSTTSRQHACIRCYSHRQIVMSMSNTTAEVLTEFLLFKQRQQQYQSGLKSPPSSMSAPTPISMLSLDSQRAKTKTPRHNASMSDNPSRQRSETRSPDDPLCRVKRLYSPQYSCQLMRVHRCMTSSHVYTVGVAPGRSRQSSSRHWKASSPSSSSLPPATSIQQTSSSKVTQWVRAIFTFGRSRLKQILSSMESNSPQNAPGLHASPEVSSSAVLSIDHLRAPSGHDWADPVVTSTPLSPMGPSHITHSSSPFHRGQLSSIERKFSRSFSSPTHPFLPSSHTHMTSGADGWMRSGTTTPRDLLRRTISSSSIHTPPPHVAGPHALLSQKKTRSSLSKCKDKGRSSPFAHLSTPHRPPTTPTQLILPTVSTAIDMVNQDRLRLQLTLPPITPSPFTRPTISNKSRPKPRSRPGGRTTHKNVHGGMHLAPSLSIRKISFSHSFAGRSRTPLRSSCSLASPLHTHSRTRRASQDRTSKPPLQTSPPSSMASPAPQVALRSTQCGVSIVNIERILYKDLLQDEALIWKALSYDELASHTARVVAQDILAVSKSQPVALPVIADEEIATEINSANPFLEHDADDIASTPDTSGVNDSTSQRGPLAPPPPPPPLPPSPPEQSLLRPSSAQSEGTRVVACRVKQAVIMYYCKPLGGGVTLPPNGGSPHRGGSWMSPDAIPRSALLAFWKDKDAPAHHLLARHIVDLQRQENEERHQDHPSLHSGNARTPTTCQTVGTTHKSHPSTPGYVTPVAPKKRRRHPNTESLPPRPPRSGVRPSSPIVSLSARKQVLQSPLLFSRSPVTPSLSLSAHFDPRFSTPSSTIAKEDGTPSPWRGDIPPPDMPMWTASFSQASSFGDGFTPDHDDVDRHDTPVLTRDGGLSAQVGLNNNTLGDHCSSTGVFMSEQPQNTHQLPACPHYNAFFDQYFQYDPTFSHSFSPPPPPAAAAEAARAKVMTPVQFSSQFVPTSPHLSLLTIEIVTLAPMGSLAHPKTHPVLAVNMFFTFQPIDFTTSQSSPALYPQSNASTAADALRTPHDHVVCLLNIDALLVTSLPKSIGFLEQPPMNGTYPSQQGPYDHKSHQPINDTLSALLRELGDSQILGLSCAVKTDREVTTNNDTMSDTENIPTGNNQQSATPALNPFSPNSSLVTLSSLYQQYVHQYHQHKQQDRDNRYSTGVPPHLLAHLSYQFGLGSPAIAHPLIPHRLSTNVQRESPQQYTFLTSNEGLLFYWLRELVFLHDVDAICGFNVDKDSLGYLTNRHSHLFPDLPLLTTLLSRTDVIHSHTVVANMKQFWMQQDLLPEGHRDRVGTVPASARSEVVSARRMDSGENPHGDADTRSQDRSTKGEIDTPFQTPLKKRLSQHLKRTTSRLALKINPSIQPQLQRHVSAVMTHISRISSHNMSLNSPAWKTPIKGQTQLGQSRSRKWTPLRMSQRAKKERASQATHPVIDIVSQDSQSSSSQISQLKQAVGREGRHDEKERQQVKRRATKTLRSLTPLISRLGTRSHRSKQAPGSTSVPAPPGQSSSLLDRSITKLATTAPPYPPLDISGRFVCDIQRVLNIDFKFPSSSLLACISQVFPGVSLPAVLFSSSTSSETTSGNISTYYIFLQLRMCMYTILMNTPPFCCVQSARPPNLPSSVLIDKKEQTLLPVIPKIRQVPVHKVIAGVNHGHVGDNSDVIDSSEGGNRITTPSSQSHTRFLAIRSTIQHILSLFTLPSILPTYLLLKTDTMLRALTLSHISTIRWYDVFLRGSQHRVEALLARISKIRGYANLSMTPAQVQQQPALEMLALTLEPPRDGFVPFPVMVFDFRSLYPSVMIAYNLCYSTCLGRVGGFDYYLSRAFGIPSIFQAPQQQRLQRPMSYTPAHEPLNVDVPFSPSQSQSQSQSQSIISAAEMPEFTRFNQPRCGQHDTPHRHPHLQTEHVPTMVENQLHQPQVYSYHYGIIPRHRCWAGYTAQFQPRARRPSVDSSCATMDSSLCLITPLMTKMSHSRDHQEDFDDDISYSAISSPFTLSSSPCPRRYFQPSLHPALFPRILIHVGLISYGFSPLLLYGLYSNGLLYISTNGVIFVHPQVRQGLCARFLSEILMTRQYIKKFMAQAKRYQAQRVVRSGDTSSGSVPSVPSVATPQHGTNSIRNDHSFDAIVQKMPSDGLPMIQSPQKHQIEPCQSDKFDVCLQQEQPDESLQPFAFRSLFEPPPDEENTKSASGTSFPYHHQRSMNHDSNVTRTTTTTPVSTQPLETALTQRVSGSSSSYDPFQVTAESTMDTTPSPLRMAMYDSLQLSLKLLANVTYGYTSASVTGRMPCSMIADAIVAIARLTLESAMDLVNNTVFYVPKRCKVHQACSSGNHERTADGSNQDGVTNIETDSHPPCCFNAIQATVLYGDTDSMFVQLKYLSSYGSIDAESGCPSNETRDTNSDHCRPSVQTPPKDAQRNTHVGRLLSKDRRVSTYVTSQHAFGVGQSIVDHITAQYPFPIRLEAEKLYYPALFFTKKRYIGNSSPSPSALHPVIDAKGVEIIRREQPLFVQMLMKHVTYLMFYVHILNISILNTFYDDDDQDQQHERTSQKSQKSQTDNMFFNLGLTYRYQPQQHHVAPDDQSALHMKQDPPVPITGRNHLQWADENATDHQSGSTCSLYHDKHPALRSFSRLSRAMPQPARMSPSFSCPQSEPGQNIRLCQTEPSQPSPPPEDSCDPIPHDHFATLLFSATIVPIFVQCILVASRYESIDSRIYTIHREVDFGRYASNRTPAAHVYTAARRALSDSMAFPVYGEKIGYIITKGLDRAKQTVINAAYTRLYRQNGLTWSLFQQRYKRPFPRLSDRGVGLAQYMRQKYGALLHLMMNNNLSRLRHTLSLTSDRREGTTIPIIEPQQRSATRSTTEFSIDTHYYTTKLLLPALERLFVLATPYNWYSHTLFNKIFCILQPPFLADDNVVPADKYDIIRFDQIPIHRLYAHATVSKTKTLCRNPQPGVIDQVVCCINTASGVSGLHPTKTSQYNNSTLRTFNTPHMTTEVDHGNACEALDDDDVILITQPLHRRSQEKRQPQGASLFTIDLTIGDDPHDAEDVVVLPTLAGFNHRSGGGLEDDDNRKAQEKDSIHGCSRNYDNDDGDDDDDDGATVVINSSQTQTATSSNQPLSTPSQSRSSPQLRQTDQKSTSDIHTTQYISNSPQFIHYSLELNRTPNNDNNNSPRVQPLSGIEMLYDSLFWTPMTLLQLLSSLALDSLLSSAHDYHFHRANSIRDHKNVTTPINPLLSKYFPSYFIPSSPHGKRCGCVRTVLSVSSVAKQMNAPEPYNPSTPYQGRYSTLQSLQYPQEIEFLIHIGMAMTMAEVNTGLQHNQQSRDTNSVMPCSCHGSYPSPGRPTVLSQLRDLLLELTGDKPCNLQQEGKLPRSMPRTRPLPTTSGPVRRSATTPWGGGLMATTCGYCIREVIPILLRPLLLKSLLSYIKPYSIYLAFTRDHGPLILGTPNSSLLLPLDDYFSHLISLKTPTTSGILNITQPQRYLRQQLAESQRVCRQCVSDSRSISGNSDQPTSDSVCKSKSTHSASPPIPDIEDVLDFPPCENYECGNWENRMFLIKTCMKQ